MPEFEFDFHRGGFSRSKGKIQTGLPQQDLINAFYREIQNLRHDINSMEGKYISLLAYYERLEENFSK